MPKLSSLEACCGCSSCANKCPKGAITMHPDKRGFLIPLVESSLCIECGACEKACPAIADRSKEVSLCKAYLLQHKDEDIRRQSTSGGAFTAFSQIIIQKGGVVFGAIMTEDNIVKHVCIDNISDLARFRNSKYVQSQIGDAYKQVKSILNSDKTVCFSGTPCQIAGLKFYLGKEYKNLITIDVVCHAIPSPFVFAKYVELIKKKHPTAEKLVFRDKKRGYSYSTMAWYDQNGKSVYRASYELDEWYRLFLHDKCDRSSCYECKYQNQPRMSDITIWDCYNACDICPEMDDNKGVTNVFVWSEKGDETLNEAKAFAKIISIDKNLTIESTRNHKRIRPEWDDERFYSDAHNLPVEDFFYKYVPRNIKSRLSSALRYILWVVGLHDIVRHFIQKIRK